MKLRTRIDLLPPSGGGRNVPLGPRSMFSCDIGSTFRGQPVPHDARITLVDVATLVPGASALAWVEPLHPQLWSAIREGATFTLQEGRRVRGHATVLEIAGGSGQDGSG